MKHATAKSGRSSVAPAHGIGCRHVYAAAIANASRRSGIKEIRTFAVVAGDPFRAAGKQRRRCPTCFAGRVTSRSKRTAKGARRALSAGGTLKVSATDLRDEEILTLLLEALRGCELTATKLEETVTLLRAKGTDEPLEFPEWINTKGDVKQ
jgi:hypothetical protein